MGMNIEVIGRAYYTVHLDDKDLEYVKEYMKEHKEDLPSFNLEKNICWAVEQLYSDGKIDLFSNRKATESDFHTETINWSEFEERTPEEILGE